MITTSEKYIYVDKDGNPLFTKERYVKNDGSKGYAYSHVNNKGETVKSMPQFASGTPLYNLHRLAKYPTQPVYFVEGEKCVDALTKHKILATTSGGATSDDKANMQPLAGRTVILFADNDTAGISHMMRVKAKLVALGAIVFEINIDALGLPPKGDVVDWLVNFSRINGRDATKADIEALAVIGDIAQTQKTDNSQTVKELPDKYFPMVSLHCAADVPPEAYEWLWDGWLAKGKLHIFAGAAGTGKTTIAIALAATITIGGKFPDGIRSPVGSVLIWSGEDSPADTLVPRLMAAGADLSKVHFIGDVTANYELRAFDPATDMQSLMIKAATIPDLALLIIDPIVNAVAGDSHKNGEVRRSLQPVVDFGLKLNCAVLGITHFSKGGQGKDPVERVTGSLAFAALARIVLVTAKVLEGDITRRVVCRAKANICIDTGGYEYNLQQKEVKAGITSSFVTWGEAVEGSARELLAEPDHRETGENGNSALDDAKDFLRDLLADSELAQMHIKADATGAGHSWRTVERAKKLLNIRSSKSPLDGKWYWKLPTYTAKNNQDRQDSQTNNVALLAELPLKTNFDDVMRF